MNARRPTGDRLRSASLWLVTAAAVLAPWLCGSAEPWAYLMVCLLVSAGVAAWLLWVLLAQAPRLRAPALTGCLLAALVLVALQIIPLPRALGRAVARRSVAARAAQVRLFAETDVGEFLPDDARRPSASTVVSVSPAATRRALYLLAAYVGAFLVAANACTVRRHVRAVAAALVVSGFALAVLGLAQKFSGTTQIYWRHTPRYGGDIFASFTNRNHYAAFANMTFGAALALCLAEGAASRIAEASGWRRKVALLAGPRGSRFVLTTFATVVIGASVCMTLSRAGILSLLGALTVVGAAGAAGGVLPRRASGLAAVALLIVGAVLWLGWRPVVERLETLVSVAREPLSDTRAAATRDTFRMFAAAPALGWGFGTFQHVFPAFQSPDIQIGRWLHAHNDYAQLAAEGGAVACALALAAVCTFGTTLWRGFRRASADARLLATGLLVGLTAIVIHSAFDYSLHKPANGLLLAVLCGMTVSAVSARGDARHRRSRKGDTWT